jgi:hypothetical protein
MREPLRTIDNMYNSLKSGGILCHEYRRSKRRCVTVREMKGGPSRSAIRC